MKHTTVRCWSLIALVAASAALSLAPRFAAASSAQALAPSLVMAPLNVNDTVALAGNTHPLATPAADQGLVPGEQPLGSLFIVLRRSPTQERALARFNARQLDAGSPDYHHWLQPQEFGLRYGPNDSDIAAVTSWLEAAGLQIKTVTAGRIAIQFSGTAAQVQKVFAVEMHRYLVQGVVAIANDRDPRIPRALSPVIAGVAGLNAFPLSASAAARHAVEIGVTPQLSVHDVENFAFMTPYDFATVYNSLPLWNASTPIQGGGVTIAVISGADVNSSDVTTYRSTFGLPSNGTSPFTTLKVGSDPGGSSTLASKTATVGLELAGAAAPAASLELVLAQSGSLADVLGAISYTVDKNLAPIVTFGYSACEKYLGTSNNAMVNSSWQQGATQGMSILVAAGDQGSAGCNYNNGTSPDTNGLQVNGFASSPFVTAVGATDFAWQWSNPAGNTFSTYWNPPTTPIQYESAKSYIIEVPWNVTCTNGILLQNQGFLISPKTLQPLPVVSTQPELCAELVDTVYYTPLERSAGGGGGYSHCTTLDTSGTCQAGSGYAKPDWQRGSGVPDDFRRDLPDVSIFSSTGWPDYGGIWNIGEPLIPGTAVLVCYTGAGDSCTYDSFGVGTSSIGNQAYGGTATAAAYWAGIVALVEQKQGGERQGLVNPTLYNLYTGEDVTTCKSSAITAGTSCVFYDVALPVTNGMTCASGSSPDCVNGILDAYTGGVGYDQTTGLGSVNIANLVNRWSTAYLPPVPASGVATGGLVDYLGDGRSDYSVWRPASGDFYIVNQQEGSTSVKQWGLSTDLPVVGDFDGDGVSDFATWRSSNGTWYVTESSTGQVVSKAWGQSGDVPVVGDFDGDGKTDYAIYRPSNGTWYVVYSSTGQVVTKQWGLSTDVPVNGDFDGDGKTDIAIYRPSNGTWYVIQSHNGAVLTKQWGLATDVPVFGDFDGDGKTDIAVFRPTNGTWYIVQSSNGQVITTQWGASGDVPAPSDYNGSGKTNLAVWRPSTATWYVYEGGIRPYLSKQWGEAGDLPLEQKAAH